MKDDFKQFLTQMSISEGVLFVFPNVSFKVSDVTIKIGKYLEITWGSEEEMFKVTPHHMSLLGVITPTEKYIVKFSGIELGLTRFFFIGEVLKDDPETNTNNGSTDKTCSIPGDE